MTKKIKVILESGKSFIAKLHDNDTANIIYKSLPIESEVTHSRWSGREFNFPINISTKPNRENQSIFTSEGDLCYWRDWRYDYEENGHTKHVFAIYYGPEQARSHVGDEPVNIFGRVLEEDLEIVKQIGESIWLEGTEKIRVEKL